MLQKRFSLVFLSLVLLLAACASQEPTPFESVDVPQSQNDAQATQVPAVSAATQTPVPTPVNYCLDEKYVLAPTNEVIMTDADDNPVGKLIYLPEKAILQLLDADGVVVDVYPWSGNHTYSSILKEGVVIALYFTVQCDDGLHHYKYPLP